MIGATRNIAFRPLLSPRVLRRRFSVKAIYSSFPATLMYYCFRPKVSLYDVEEAERRLYDNYSDGVTIDNGLVFPRVSNDLTTSNGAVMYPNTFFMQELARRHYDEALDREEDGQQVDTPYIFSVPKGTPIPSHLILINDYNAVFSLQPARGMPLRALNEALDEFYDKHAEKETAGAWLDKHPYHLAIDDDTDAKWMLK
ncbi:hypothetical protein F5Y01DRAFT_134331 [Xylaria sp. FL0043]|nr:hypothetical protein F5Y01DRAFT_134331 [Xylaria sp. FL0043]